MITDAQVHLWEANRPDRPWPEGAKADLPEPMTAERFLPMMDEIGVDRAIIAPPYVAGFTPTYALECAARYPKRLAVMGRYDPEDPSSPDLLPHWLDAPGMLALRLNLNNPHGPRYEAAGLLAPFWAAAERYRIPVAISSLQDVSKLHGPLERHPELRLIVDHLGLFLAPRDEWDVRLEKLLDLAKHPNIGVKISALPLVSKEPYPFADLHEPIRRIHGAYGPRRMFWGGDQSTVMSRNSTTYRQNIDTIRVEAAKFLPAEDIEWILGRALAGWLRWPEE